MPASEFSPMAFALVAVCGGSTPDPGDVPTSTGLTCNEYNLMIKVELMVGKRCDYDEECDQIIPVDDTCPTADRVVSSEFDSSYLFDLIDDAEAEGCTVEYPGSRGDCDPDAIAICDVGNYTWL